MKRIMAVGVREEKGCEREQREGKEDNEDSDVIKGK